MDPYLVRIYERRDSLRNLITSVKLRPHSLSTGIPGITTDEEKNTSSYTCSPSELSFLTCEGNLS
jgi:hypothetical protein